MSGNYAQYAQLDYILQQITVKIRSINLASQYIPHQTIIRYTNMDCTNCHSKLDLQSNIPTMYKQGKILCMRCWKSIDTRNKSMPPIVNNALLSKISKMCLNHSVEKDVYSVTSEVFYCPQCLIYDSTLKDVVKNQHLIQSNQIKSQINDTETKIRQCFHLVEQAQLLMKNKKNKIIQIGYQKIQKEYLLALQDINQRKKCAENKLTQKMAQIECAFLNSQAVNKFHKFKQYQRNGISKKTLKKQLQNLKNVEQIKQEHRLVCIQVETQMSDILDMQYFDKIQSNNPELSFELSLSEEGDDEKITTVYYEKEQEQMLLGEDIVGNFSWQKCQEQDETQMDSNKSIASTYTELPSLSTSRVSTCSKNPFHKKSVLNLTTANFPKVASTIKQVRACSLKLGSVQAKKLIRELKDTFVSKLDLSANRLTSNFIIGLNKQQVGKYLKQIRVCDNNIEMSSAVSKKIQLLQKQGVRILF